MLNSSKVFPLLILLFSSTYIHALNYHITTADLNLREGPGMNYASSPVLKKGDTVQLLDGESDYWLKVQHGKDTGYVAQSYLQPLAIAKKTKEPGISSQQNDENYTSTLIGWLFFLAFLSIIAVALFKTGQKYRSKTTVCLLALFFGSFGLHKFYLGHTAKGIASLLFWWTLIPALVGLIDFIRIVTMNSAWYDFNYNGLAPPKEAFTPQKSQPAQKQPQRKVYTQTVSATQTRDEAPYQPKKPQTVLSSHRQEPARPVKDTSIIDIGSEKLDLAIEGKTATEKPVEPPYWAHSYIYSYNAINEATAAQKRFYNYLKSKVNQGEWVDIQGYTNYAFILYFDFLNEYENHRDIKRLDQQFKLIGEICPKTTRYTAGLLKDELRKRNDAWSVQKLKDLDDPVYQFDHGYSDYNPDLYKLGNQYKDKLGLSKQEIRWLNKFYNPDNVFLAIEGCRVATLRQYILLLKELDKHLKGAGTTLVEEIKYFKEQLKSMYAKQYDSWAYYDKSSLGNRAESEIYLTLFKRVENSVRDALGHKRKLSDGFPYAEDQLSENFEIHLGALVNELMNLHQGQIEEPDLPTRIELNAQNVNRWKEDFDKLKAAFRKEEKDKFIGAICQLEEANQKNPNIEHIFFEASKFMAKYDKVQSLKYYAQYIYYDLQSKKIDNKALTKTVQKSLFQKDEQIEDFKKLIAELMETRDIQKALEEIPKIYIPKRKKIKLNHSAIAETEQKHAGTVELLSGYLETEDTNKTETPTETENTAEEEVQIIPSEESNSLFIVGLNLSAVQQELIQRIANHSFTIPQSEVDRYATENGLFKNQLIDSINEACGESLESEALIEEDEDNYIMEESFYKEIVR